MKNLGKTTVRVLALTALVSVSLASTGCYINTKPSFGEESPRDYVQAQQNTPKQPLVRGSTNQ